VSVVFTGPGVIRDPSGKHHDIGAVLDGLGFSEEHLRILVRDGHAKEIAEGAVYAPPTSRPINEADSPAAALLDARHGANLKKLDEDYAKQGSIDLPLYNPTGTGKEQN
jgi:hypothetical protein